MIQKVITPVSCTRTNCLHLPTSEKSKADMPCWSVGDIEFSQSWWWVITSFMTIKPEFPITLEWKYLVNKNHKLCHRNWDSYNNKKYRNNQNGNHVIRQPQSYFVKRLPLKPTIKARNKYILCSNKRFLKLSKCNSDESRLKPEFQHSK